ncbi:MAG TPA: right-handed parallel beta-helix repeat-containing protein [Lachnospiraceae bacterium]|nr:right-handed parallel beta-helix repeat-containing protein [Lachnospiraceae bacterium]
MIHLNYMQRSIKKSSFKPVRIFRTTLLLLFIIFLSIVSSSQRNTSATAVKTYTVSTTSAPYQDKYKKSSFYNSFTKQYFMLRSYLEQLEKLGGGVLYLKAGTYTITNSLYVPSNVTIKFADKVVIKKGTKTGSTLLKPTSSIFQLVAPSKYKINGTYSAYDGEQNIHFVALGKATIDLSYSKDCIGILMGHNKNVSITGITFQNMYSGHFIEMDASYQVTVDSCTFQNHKDSLNNNKEAINLDTPDRTTEGFHNDWSSYDCTPNKEVTIKNCNFSNLERAIGTHKYSANQYHTNINVLNNTITSCDQDAIRVMNWSSPIITNNSIDTVAEGKGIYRCILISGVTNPTITNNTFKNAARAIQIMPWRNSGPGSQYDTIYNSLSPTNISDMQKNIINNVGESFIRYNKTYLVYDKDTEKIYFN